MGSKNSRIEDSRDFFEKKFKSKLLLEEFEKKIFEASGILEQAIDLVVEMESIALKRKAFYFLHRTRRLKLQLNEFMEKKGYEKKEFDFAYKIMEKIDENESSDFLDKILKGKIEKIAQDMRSTDTSPKKSSPYVGQKKYFTFNFRGVYFIVAKKPQKIIRNVNPMKSNVRIGSARYPIYPGPHFGITPSPDEITEPTHLCILNLTQDIATPKHQEDQPPGTQKYRCFFYHKMDKEIQFDESTVRSRLKPLEEGLSPYIKSFFRYAGRNYYLIETDVDYNDRSV